MLILATSLAQHHLNSLHRTASVFLIRVTSAGQHESFELFKTFVPKMNIFHSWLCTLKMCRFLLCRTSYLLYSGRSNCILHHLYM